MASFAMSTAARVATVAAAATQGDRNMSAAATPSLSAASVGRAAPKALSGRRAMSSVSKVADRSSFAAQRMSVASKKSASATCAVATEAPAAADEPVIRDDVRNIAIIAHVDHGKTTLVDAMLVQSKVFRDNQKMDIRVMDSNDLERERGITILSKNTAITYKGTKINVIDTPGHADFGGEVERVLNMCDGVLLLVDSVEGPMPQTRFVLKKALELNRKVVVVVNKIDRPAARPDFVIDTTFELFCDLGADDEQCDFPVVYASGVNGIAGPEPDELSDNLEPLFDMIVKEVPGPTVLADQPLQLLVTNIDYDEHKGRIAIGRLNAGTISSKQQVSIGVPDKDARKGKVGELFIYENFGRVSVDNVEAGDICAFAGLPDVMIGETVMATEGGTPLPTIDVEEPTVRMTFMVNNSPFAGQEGKFVTSRNLRERLYRETERNLAMKIEDGDTADSFIVSGRGALHITILIENMRREGYEFQIGPPQVIFKEDDKGSKLEPFEDVEVEVAEAYMGSVVDMLAQRKGEMLDMNSCNDAGACTVKYRMPTRGLLGLRNAMLTATKGTMVMNSQLAGYYPFAGEIGSRENGSLIAYEQGTTTSYALFACQDRGVMFLGPGVNVYEGMIVGVHQRPGDLKLNVCKKKAATNVRSNKDATVVLNSPKDYSLDDAVEYISPDECVEVTPESIRLRKMPNAGKAKR